METLLLIWQAATLRAGPNAALVTVGAALLGAAAGGVGTFVLLRRRSLVSDAISHATLPGVGLAFLALAALGIEGRPLWVLLLGASASAALGLWLIDAMTRHTRLSEDAAIGAVLSVFFGFGIVLLTVIQTLPGSGQAGLETLLLGSAAGMLRSDAMMLAIAALLSAIVLWGLRRPLLLTAFDAEQARLQGWPAARIDQALMVLVLVVTVIGLRVVGLILIVALMIIPPATARFWTDRAGRMVLLAAALGALAGYLGTVLSASIARLPTGPVIVLVAATLFTLSFLLSPRRGVVAAALRHRHFQHQVHRRQGLLAMSRGEAIYDRLTLVVLRRAGLIRADGVATLSGRQAAAEAVLDERRRGWLQRHQPELLPAVQEGGLADLSQVLAADQLARLDQAIAAGTPLTLDRGRRSP